jgi:nanoRNase/pAp phosphatase (c-di-AMP/oligoRNAs hydrolase)
VLEIAQSFGGGGHPQAAGFQTAGGRAHVLGSVLSRIEVELLSEAGISRGR